MDFSLSTSVSTTSISITSVLSWIYERRNELFRKSIEFSPIDSKNYCWITIENGEMWVDLTGIILIKNVTKQDITIEEIKVLEVDRKNLRYSYHLVRANFDLLAPDIPIPSGKTTKLIIFASYKYEGGDEKENIKKNILIHDSFLNKHVCQMEFTNTENIICKK